MNKRIAFAALALLFVTAPAFADFDSLVDAVDRMPDMHREWMPGISLVRLAVWMIHPKGVYDFQIATFKGKGNLADPKELDALLRQHADAGYRPLVQAQSRRTGEVALIWARPAGGDRIEVLLLTHQRSKETVVLRAVVDPETLARDLDHPHAAARMGMMGR